MSREEQKDNCNVLDEEYEGIKNYCQAYQKGEYHTLISDVAIACGHCYRTASERVRLLVDNKVIIRRGLYWEYNTNQKNPERIAILKAFINKEDVLTDNIKPEEIPIKQPLNNHFKPDKNEFKTIIKDASKQIYDQREELKIKADSSDGIPFEEMLKLKPFSELGMNQEQFETWVLTQIEG